MPRPVFGDVNGNGGRRGRERAFLAVSFTALLGYLALFLLVRANRSVRADLATTIRFQRQDHPALARLMGAVSWFGFQPQNVLLPLSVIAGTWALRRRLESLFLVLAWASSFLSFVTKLLVRRPRPGNPLIRVVEADIHDTSFPSGHTLHYTAFWGFFSYVVVTRAGHPFWRWLTVAVVSSLTALVGPSRIYLGHHWLTDVLASYLLGTAYLLGLVALYRRVRDWLSFDANPDAVC
ncbi:MAG TPA: phosphatase PAP2 family protein [Thermomicrobiaceae bacterium]|nr:phosphatase PAP2 family protein [Thermomicrobiaceae bacterium]